MRNNTDVTEASRQYAAAHAAQYQTKDKGTLAAHPDTQEAGV